MEDLKIYGFSAVALLTSLTPINPALQTTLLIFSIVYTGLGIYNRIKNNGRN
jgi:hypothetical protein